MEAIIKRKHSIKKECALLFALCCAYTTPFQAHAITPPKKNTQEKTIHNNSDHQNSSFIISRGINANLIHSNKGVQNAPPQEENYTIELDHFSPISKQIGAQAKAILNKANAGTKIINTTIQSNTFIGTTLSFNKSDLEKTLITKSTSPQELWKKTGQIKKSASTYAAPPHLFHINAHVIEDISPPTKNSNTYHRTSLVANIQQNMRKSGLINHIGIRLNIANNFDDNTGRYTQNTAYTPIRSDINLFAQRRMTLETAFISKTHSFTPSFHTMVSAGYLDEQFSGIGAQLLYRPYTARYAFGGQIWGANKRDPLTIANLGATPNYHYAALINAHYTFPKQDITLHAQAGRYLAGDLGGKIGIEKEFSNGATLSGELSISNKEQYDADEDATRTKQSLNLKIPLGKSSKYKIGADAKLNLDTVGDDITQTINTPHKIYNMTTSLNVEKMTKNWEKISE